MRLINPFAKEVCDALTTDDTLRMPIADDDRSTAQTIAAMRAVVHDAAQYGPYTSRLATACAKRGHTIKTLYEFIREYVNFRPDKFGTEQLHHPEYLLAQLAGETRTPSNIGEDGKLLCDCDDVAMLGAAVLLTAGMRPFFVTIARTANEPYKHVHYAVWFGDSFGQSVIIPCDPQERLPIGTWTPSARRATWPV